jgi:proteasome accessory factor A
MKKRVYGLENEYGLIFMAEGRPTASIEKVARYLFEKIITRENNLNIFLENGGRFYLDTGFHPEYATPECATPLELVIYDKAGEWFLEHLLPFAEERLRAEGFEGKLFVFKNNSDLVGNSYGCHENYLIDRNVDFPYLVHKLIPFLVTRQIFTGAGQYWLEGNQVCFSLSQRARYISQIVSGTSTNERSIINTRDESHTSGDRYRRLHLIFGDSNMSEYTTYLKIGTTSLILDMIEDHFIEQDFSFQDTIVALKAIAADPTCRRRVALENGNLMSALEIQQRYLALAQAYYTQRETDASVQSILNQWRQVLQSLAQHPPQLHRKIDWVIKKALIDRYIAQKQCPVDVHKILMMDLQYHEVRKDKSLYYLLERRQAVERVTSDKAIMAAMDTPPQTTRAKLRGEFIRLARQKKIAYEPNWNYNRFDPLLKLRVELGDPFQEDNETVMSLRAQVEALPS